MPACRLLANEPAPFGAHEQRFSGGTVQLALALTASDVETAAHVTVGDVAVGVLLMRLRSKLLDRLSRRGPPERHSGAVGEPLGYEPEVALLQKFQGVHREGVAQHENANREVCSLLLGEHRPTGDTSSVVAVSNAFGAQVCDLGWLEHGLPQPGEV